uniref:Uncharacterized protein n=1 Tax=Anguilla anguilla TaxID=7936 RepID=A0A0E9PK00_ANGAN
MGSQKCIFPFCNPPAFLRSHYGGGWTELV